MYTEQPLEKKPQNSLIIKQKQNKVNGTNPMEGKNKLYKNKKVYKAGMK